jgi:probable F420-dependent oxidoreductase
MQFGVFLPTHWAVYRDRDRVAAITDVAQAADALGYESVWAFDHLLVPSGYADYGHILEPLITLATLIPIVPRLRLGTSVLVLPQRHAVLVAKQAAALDILSHGRFILGIGTGWIAEEFHFLNASFDQRGARTDEAIAVMRTLWREQPASFQGQFYAFTDALFGPKPRHGGPPVWIGGNRLPAIQRAARVGDAWLPFWLDWESFQHGLATFHVRVAKLQQLRDGKPRLPVVGNLRFRIPSSQTGAAASEPNDISSVIETFQQYAQAGLTYVICDFQADDVADLLRQMRVLTEDIAPHLEGNAHSGPSA